MASTDVRAAIVATLESVPGIGVVHAYERYAKKVGEFAALYQRDDLLLGWYVHRRAERTATIGVGHDTTTTEWLITGYRALEDDVASALAFDSLVDAVIDAFRADHTLGGVVGSIVDPDTKEGPGLIESQPVMFAGVLCHRAILRLVTRVY